jgi:SAM-dependent methyltransferase
MAETAYTTDVVYPSAFGAFQSPAHLAQAAWVGGRAAPRIDRPFVYADLGSGVGLTLCVLADCYPEAEFHGVDLNPEHIRRSRDLAARAGLTNVTFHEASFADLPSLGLPRLDFAGLSGIYSWLTRDLRAACMGFLGQALKPDGVLFLHYAALPGNAQVDALYALIRETARDLPGDSVARFRAACAAVGRLRAAKARFFQINPQADAWFARLEDQDAAGMAHEVLNAMSTSLSARDAADEAARAGLAFVANAQLELNDLALTAPDALRPDLEGLGATAREMLMDAVRNTHSRMDVMMRTGAPPAAGPPAMWADRVSRGPLRDERRQLAQRTGVDLFAPAYEAVLARVDGKAVALAELVADPAIDAAAIQRLAALKLVHLLARPYAPASSGPLRLASRLNRLVLEEEIESAGPMPFASPVAGTQVLLPPADRLALLSLLDGDFAAAWARLAAAGQVARIDGRALDGPAALREAAARRANALGPQIIHRLSVLGVLS